MALSYATYTKLIDYVGGTNAIYIGTATTGAAAGDLAWTIQKITYDGNNNPTAIQWASQGVGGLVWTARATYTYS